MLIKMMDKDSKGFTLIELMIVIAIIGILAAIAIPQFSAYRKRGYNSAAQSDLKNAITAQEAYFVDNQNYASSTSDLTSYGFNKTDDVTVGITLSSNKDSYTMTAYHSKGNKTYSISGPGGTIGAM